ncbi:MAG: glycosyltransferase [Clostridium sp.]|nr:glycosyltransferase [Clostridium sp.]
MKNNRLISIIVPVYNVEDYLEECLNSLVHQTYQNLEILLVNDGSTDSSGEICEKYAKHDSRIRVIKKRNGGLSSARNAGIEVAKGDFIGFVDGDDYVSLDMYEKLLDACEKNASSIAVCHAVTFQDGEKPIESYGYIKKSYCTSDKIVTFRNALSMSQSVCNKLFQRKLFHEIRFPEGRVVEDAYILYDLLYRARKVSYVALCGYFYRRRVESITTRKYKKKDADFIICNVRTYCRVKRQIPELWEEALCRVINSGFVSVIIKVKELNFKEFLLCYHSFRAIQEVLSYLMNDLMRSKRISDEMKEYVALFIKNPFKLYYKIKKEGVLIGEEKNNRIAVYNQLTDQWNLNQKEHKEIEDYFIRKGIKSIAIYGSGTMGDRLYAEIKSSAIQVICFIDQSADSYVYGLNEDVELIKPEQIRNIKNVDAIIVTPVHVYKSIEAVIRENGYKGEIISLETVVYEL